MDNRFVGDGREKIEPSFNLPGCKAIAVTRAQARQAIARFERIGHSTHSAQAGMVWVLIEWCHLNNIQYTIVGVPNAGYYITKNT